MKSLLTCTNTSRAHHTRAHTSSPAKHACNHNTTRYIIPSTHSIITDLLEFELLAERRPVGDLSNTAYTDVAGRRSHVCTHAYTHACARTSNSRVQTQRLVLGLVAA
jgi:hypothetical protein